MEIEPVPWSFTIEFDEGKARLGGRRPGDVDGGGGR